MKTKSVINPLVTLPQPVSTVKYDYINPTPGHLPLMAIGTPKGVQNFSQEVLQKMKDCGINIAQNMLSSSAIESALSNASLVGDFKITVRLNEGGLFLGEYPKTNLVDQKKYRDIAKMISPESEKWQSLARKWRGIVTAYSSHPSAAGWMLYDEPNEIMFWGMGALKNAIDLAASNHLIFTNMFPWLPATEFNLGIMSGGLNEAPTAIIGGYRPKVTSYENYLSLFKSFFNPGLLSFDSYPFPYDTNNTQNDLKAFFYSLSLYSKYRSDYNVSFWSTVQTCNVKQYIYNELDELVNIVTLYENPSALNIRYQCLMALAFGAQGLSFWRFSDEESYNSKGNLLEEKIKSPLDKNGNKSATFNKLKSVLSDLKKYESVFINAVDFEVRLTNYPMDLEEEDLPLVKIAHRQPDSTQLRVPLGHLRTVEFTSGLVLSKFTHSATWEYIVVVNMDSKNPQKIKVGFDADAIDLIGYPHPLSSTFEITLNPADWRIFKLQK